MMMVFGLLSGLAGCADPVAALQQEVIAVHDEAMPLMGKISSRERSLRDTLEAVRLLENPDSTRINQLQAAVSQLQDANEAMMDWMRNYTPPAASQTTDESLLYLQGEMEKITAIKQQMLESLGSPAANTDSP